MKGIVMIFFMGVIGLTLILSILFYREAKDRKVNETKIRDKTLEYLRGKEHVSIIELIEHVNIMPHKVFSVIKKMQDVDLISEKNGKVKITKFGEKAYENILKGE